MRTAQEGDLALLIGRDKKSFIIRLHAGYRFHTHRGILNHDDLIGAPWGQTFETHLGHSYLFLMPSIHDLIMNVKRITQIVYPKEIGQILLKLNVGPGKRIVEAGTGSGALTLALANAVGPSGHIYTYEQREQMSNTARNNLARAGLEDRVTFYVRDLGEGVDETDMDAFFLDVREPWLYLDHVRAAVVAGGFFGCLVPTTNQVQELVRALHRYRFISVEVLELLERGYKPVSGRLRPKDRMVAHTGYLIFGRTTARPVSSEEKERPGSDKSR